MPDLRLLLSTCCACLLVACGGSVDDATTRDAPAPADPTPPPFAPSDAPRHEGGITMLSIVGDGGGFLASAWFAAGDRPAASNAASCVADSSADDVAETSAGAIRIDVPSAAGAPTTLDLSFDPKAGHYELGFLDAPDGSSRFDMAGAPIRVHAEGATVPAFDVELPSAANVTFEEPAGDVALSPRSDDIPLRWTDGGNDEVFVSLALGDASITCIFPASDGAASIPGDLVARAAAGYLRGPRGPASLLLASMRPKSVLAGDWEVNVAHGIAVTRVVNVTP